MPNTKKKQVLCSPILKKGGVHNNKTKFNRTKAKVQLQKELRKLN